MRLSTAVCGLLLATVMPGASLAESIDAALASAYDQNPTLNAQRAATRANDENLAQAKSGFRPQVFASADVARSVTTVNRSGTTAITPYGVGISISQNLFNGFRTVNNVKAARASILVSRETLRNVEQNVLLQAANSYVGVLRARALLDIRRRNIGFLQEQKKSSKARLDVGEGTRTDLAQSQAELARAQAQLSAAEAELSTARGAYRQIIGRNPSNLHWPKGPLSILPHGESKAKALAAKNHPSILATRHGVDAAAFNVKVAEGAFLPTVDATGTAAKRYNSSSQGTNVESVEGKISVSIPLYQGGRTSSVVRQGKQTLSQRRILVDEARDSVRQEVVTAWTQMRSANANLAANKAQIRAAKLALSGVIEERNVGQRTQLEVLQAQNSVLQAQELQIQSRTSLVGARYRLAAAIGRLNSQALRLRVAHYAPQEHTDAIEDLWFGLRTPSGQ